MPRIQMTPVVRLTLCGLCVYVFTLLGLIGLKFVREFSAAQQREQPPAAQAAEPPAPQP